MVFFRPGAEREMVKVHSTAENLGKMMLAMIFGGVCKVFFLGGGGRGKMFIQVRCWVCNFFFDVCFPLILGEMMKS